MKKIPLKDGRFALVDDTDFEKLSPFKYYVNHDGYAQRTRQYGSRTDGSRTVKSFRLHRDILGDEAVGKEIDHINGDKLDNRRANLRVATRAQNVINSGAYKNNNLGIRGVCYRFGKYIARIGVNGKLKQLGTFTTAEEASAAYNAAAQKYFGKFARSKMITDHAPETLKAFEARIANHFAAGELPCLVHLSGGNEEQLIEIFQNVRADDWVFSTHRSHSHALLKGIPEAKVESEILAGRSMFIFSAEHRFYTSAILGGNCPIAAGVAYAIKQRGSTERVYCFLGDGAEENGSFYESALFAEANELPITFIIEDNQRQVDTDKVTRRGLNMQGNHAWRPLDHFRCVRRYYYTPSYPHGGAGLPAGSVTFKPEAIARMRESTQ